MARRRVDGRGKKIGSKSQTFYGGSRCSSARIDAGCTGESFARLNSEVSTISRANAQIRLKSTVQDLSRDGAKPSGGEIVDNCKLRRGSGPQVHLPRSWREKTRSIAPKLCARDRFRGWSPLSFAGLNRAVRGRCVLAPQPLQGMAAHAAVEVC